MKELIAKLRYMARQYTAGSHARGGNPPSKHYLDEAADVIERLDAELSSLMQKHNALHVNAHEARDECARLRKDLEALAHQWSKRSDMAHPSDAMLINMHMRELRAALAAKGYTK